GGSSPSGASPECGACESAGKSSLAPARSSGVTFSGASGAAEGVERLKRSSKPMEITICTECGKQERRGGKPGRRTAATGGNPTDAFMLNLPDLQPGDKPICPRRGEDPLTRSFRAGLP